MPQRRAHAGEQFVHPEGFRQIVVRAEVESLDFASLIATARQHHDRHTVVTAADCAQEIMALNIGKSEIEDDQRGVLGQQFDTDFAVWSLQDLVSLRSQTHSQQSAYRRLIVDHQDLDRRYAHAAVSSASDRAGIGKRIVNTAPLRSLRFAAEMVPCMASTNPREIARPSPVPARTWSPFCAR